MPVRDPMYSDSSLSSCLVEYQETGEIKLQLFALALLLGVIQQISSCIPQWK